MSDAASSLFEFDARNEHEADRIANLEWQCNKDGEFVTYLEKVKAQNVFGANYDCWNVRTDKERCLIITIATNLQAQELVPSLGYTHSFHIGVTARVQSARKGASDVRVGDRLVGAFRRQEQAAEALDASAESEGIHAVARSQAGPGPPESDSTEDSQRLAPHNVRIAVNDARRACDHDQNLQIRGGPRALGGT